MRVWGVVVLALLASNCGGEDVAVEPPPPDDGCPPERRVGERCLEVGMAPEDCAEGFEHDGNDSCVPILPAARCPPGLMAVVGEQACREVAPCGEGTWGGLELTPTTLYVDASSTVPVPDGSAAAPFVDIQAAVDAAVNGGSIVVAAGSYPGFSLTGKAVRLRGRCPAMVDVSLGPLSPRVQIVGPSTSGSELGGMAVRGAAGVGILGATDLAIDSLWIHDTDGRGFELRNDNGPASATVRNSLIESNQEFGVFASGVDLTIQGSVVRGTTPDADGNFGRGINAVLGLLDSARTTLTLEATLVEQARDIGVYMAGGDASVSRSVVREVTVTPGPEVSGGVVVISRGAMPATMTVVDSAIERNESLGIGAMSADLLVERSVVRDTLAEADGFWGRGVSVFQEQGGAPSSGRLIRSVVSNNHEVGVLALGSTLSIEHAVIRDTQSRDADLDFGRGLSAQAGNVDPVPSQLVVSDTLVSHNVDTGIFAYDADATLDGVVILDVQPRQVDGLQGDAAMVWSYLHPSTLTIQGSRIARSARVGLLSFAASLHLGGSELACNAIDLDGETLGPQPYDFVDLGSNVCRDCDGEPIECRLQTTSLTPPAPIP